MNEIPELKCCPFCGCTRVEYDTGAIECYQCAARGPAEIKIHVAAAEWNRRLTDEQVERLQRDLANIRAEFTASDTDTVRGLRAELAARNELLAEFLVDGAEVVQTHAGYDRYDSLTGCYFCLTMPVWSDAHDDWTYPHTDACVVTRARAALAGVVAGGGNGEHT